MTTTSAPKRYEGWEGNNLFLCGGRVMLGASYRHLCITGAATEGCRRTRYTGCDALFIHLPRCYRVSVRRCWMAYI